MQQQYTAPKLILAGETDDIVLGSLGIGTDAFSQRMPPGMEFEEDEPWSLTQGD